MIIRTKNGNYEASNTLSLLEFFGVKQGAAGVVKLSSDIELIASVPFHLTEDTEGEKDLFTVPDGIAWTLSTYDLDRFEERIDPAGWDYKQYLKNPIVQWAHCFDIPAIGKIEGLNVDDKGLHGFVVFNDKEYDQFGWSIGQRVKNNVIRAGSVGFRAIEIEIPSKKDSEDGTSLIFRKQELLEFSICNVPANPFALAKNIETQTKTVTQELNHPNFWGGLINKL